MRDALRLDEWVTTTLHARAAELFVVAEELAKNAYPIDHGAQIGVEADDLYALQLILKDILSG